MNETQVSETSVSAPKRRRWVLPLTVLAIVVLVISGALFWFFGGEPPAEVDLAATASSVADQRSGTTRLSTGVDAGIEGSWVVDTTVGEFTVVETTTATFVGFRVEEVLSSIGSTTAVGRTPTVNGTITVEGTVLASAEIRADLTAIVSDEPRREDSIQRALNTSTNPEAVFVLSEPVELGEGAAGGELVEVVATGDLTINGVTKRVEIEVEAKLVEDKVLVTGTTEVAFADYDLTAPTSPAVLSVEDHGTIEFQVWLSR